MVQDFAHNALQDGLSLRIKWEYLTAPATAKIQIIS